MVVCPATSCTKATLANMMATDVARYCESIREYYEKGGAYSSGAQTSVAITGTLSGAVAAPLASSTKLKNSLSGLSGAANAMQQEIGSTYKTIDALNRAEAVALAYKQGVYSFNGAIKDENTDQLSLIVSQTALMCAAAGDVASQDSLASLVPAPSSSASTSNQQGTNTHLGNLLK